MRKAYTLSSILVLLVNVLMAQSMPPVQFSVERGFHDTAFTLALSSDSTSATIRYTFDGTAPTTVIGTIYTEPISVNSSSVIRAIAYTDLDTSEVVTHSYLFLSSVFHQFGIPAGFPEKWGEYEADYEVAAAIADSTAYRNMMIQSFDEFPVISLVTNQGFLFDDSLGIYTNSERSGSEWERPVSVEMMHSDGTKGFQENAGLRIMGGITRKAEHYKKHSLRLLFKSEYGAKKLNYPVFGEAGEDKHNTLVLRMIGQFNVTDHRAYQAEKTQIFKDQFFRKLQEKMEHTTVRGRFVHVFLNGLYWGMYNLTERPDAAYMEEYFGGDKEDYDALNALKPVDGDSLAWYEMIEMVDAGLNIEENYQNIQNYLDFDNFFDYMLLNHWGLNTDWDLNNWYATRKREAGEKFRFFSWDAEFTLAYFGAYYQGTVCDQNLYPYPRYLFHKLMDNTNAYMKFADRVQCHCFDDGILTPENTINHYTQLSEQTKNIAVAETARWGDMTGIQYTFNDHIKPTTEDILMNELPSRTDDLITFYRLRGFFPLLSGVEFSQNGGMILSTQSVFLTNPNVNGEIYYTTDGTDPRMEDGSLSPAAIHYTQPFQIADNVVDIKARVFKLSTGLMGNQWSAMCPKRFFVGQNLHSLVINEINYHPDSLCSSGQGSELDYVEVVNVGNHAINLTDCYFSQGVKYTFPYGTILNTNEYYVIAENVDSFAVYYGFKSDDQYGGALSNGGETIAINDPFHRLIDSVALDDVSPWDAGPDGGGASLELLNPAWDNNNPINWFRANYACEGTPGAANSRHCDFVEERVVINEINYNSNNSADPGDWVELYNPMPYELNLSGWQFFDENNGFTFPEGITLAADAYLVLVEDSTMFASIFPNVSNYFGSFGFNLSGGGERITILADAMCVADYVIYDDNAPWNTMPDGTGATLSLINTGFDNNLHSSWIPSTYLNAPRGTPGRTNGLCPTTTVAIPLDICSAEKVVLKPDNLNEEITYKWIVNGDIANIIEANSLEVIWETGGNYTVQLLTQYYECSSTQFLQIVVEECTPPLPSCVEIDLKVIILEGAYDVAADSMKTKLNTVRKLLPVQTPTSNLVTPTPAEQPYGISPWNYTGTEGEDFTDADYTEELVDWVLVSFRTEVEAAAEVSRTAALLLSNGNVDFVDRCALDLSQNIDSVYAVVEHRNHIGVMTPYKIPILNGVLTYDFTLQDSYKDPTSYGQKQLAPDVWGMFCCDGNQQDIPSFDINGNDKTIWFDSNGFFDLYIPADYNMDGDINGADKAIWVENNGISSRVPKY